MALLLMLLFPPYFGIDTTSQGRVHASLGYYPVWAPPTGADALPVLAGEAVAPHVAIEPQNIDVRMNGVRLVINLIAMVIVVGTGLVVLRSKRESHVDPQGPQDTLKD